MRKYDVDIGQEHCWRLDEDLFTHGESFFQHQQGLLPCKWKSQSQRNRGQSKKDVETIGCWSRKRKFANLEPASFKGSLLLLSKLSFDQPKWRIKIYELGTVFSESLLKATPSKRIFLSSLCFFLHVWFFNLLTSRKDVPYSLRMLEFNTNTFVILVRGYVPSLLLRKFSYS